MKTIAMMLLLACACSPAPSVTVDNKILVPSGDDAGQVVQDAAGPERDAAPAGEDAGDAAEGPIIDAGSDVYRDLDAGIDGAIIDAGVDTADAYDGIHCLTTQFGLVIGCDGYTGPSTSGYEIKTAAYDCPADGSGYGTCVAGSVCEVVESAGGVTNYYPGSCQ